MVSAIHIYVEGGGYRDKEIKTKLRQGFSTFLNELRELARSKRLDWKIVACGSRKEAYDDFCIAVQNEPEAFNVLLVDAEGPVKEFGKCWKHLKERKADDWDCPPGVEDSQCHLMAQAMESWLIADQEALRTFYNVKKLPGSFPKNPDVEQIAKATLFDALKKASALSKTKGTYHKTDHAFDLLARADVEKVRKAAPHCERLFATLATAMT